MSASEGSTVLVIDDDRDLVEMLQQALEAEGYAVISAFDGREGLRQFYDRKPDVVVLDVMLPLMDGWVVCERIREMSNVPVLMLTGRTRDMEVTKGLYLGADDYITKPFSMSEFLARVRAVVRRSGEAPKQLSRSFLNIRQGLGVDLAKRKVIVEGRPEKSLSPTEQRILSVLVAHAGELVTTEELLERVWGPGSGKDSGKVKTYVHYLRKKLERDPSKPEFILTERGVGYRFRVPEN